jgi:hypothetical protein
MSLLVDLYLETGDAAFLEPLPRAIAWLRRSEIEPGRWARLYEPGTNRPIFGDRDGKIYYAVEELTLERQTGYAWKGAFGVPAAMAQAQAALTLGREGLLARRDTAAQPGDPAKRIAEFAPRVRAAIDTLSADGWWLATVGGAPAITTATYIANVRLLCDYLETLRAANE